MFIKIDCFFHIDYSIFNIDKYQNKFIYEELEMDLYSVVIMLFIISKMQ